ncbi:putative ribonuclease H-like domain-containing protein [Tanacetum coccineum]
MQRCIDSQSPFRGEVWGNQGNGSRAEIQSIGSDFVMLLTKACFMGLFDHVQALWQNHQSERMVIMGNNYNKVNYNYTTKRTHPNAQRNMVPRVVLMKTGLKTFNTARTVNTAHPKSTVFSAKSILRFSKAAQSTERRPFQSKIALSNKRFTHKVNTAKAQAVNTARPSAVILARQTQLKLFRPNSAVVNAVRVNQANVVKASACWVWRPTKPNGASHQLEEHYFTLLPGRSKGKHTQDDIRVVLTVLPDESHILLKIPRKDNMYSFHMKNIVSKESLTFLVAKATLDESMLWHRRLGHINFKNINKLVKYNLDETYEILKNFINEIENLVDKKVKIIRSDNGTEFKNKVMDDFCREKGTITNKSADASFFDSPSKDVGNVEPTSATDDQKQAVIRKLILLDNMLILPILKLILVGDEAVHKEFGDSMERAVTIASSLEAEQDSGNINRTQSMATLNGSCP